MKRSLFGFLILVLTFFSARGQLLEYGAGIGGVVYWGDMNAPDFGTNITNTNLGIQAIAKLNLNTYLAIKGSLMYGTLSGDDGKSSLEWQKQRNLDFTSPIFEMAIMGEFHIFGYNYGEENPISPYLTAGLGVFYFNPSTVYKGVKYELQPLGTEGQGMPGFASKYNRIALSVPFGAGAKFKFSNAMNISLDVIGRRSFTDYIDDLSTNYVAYEELAAGNGPIAAALGNRIGEYLGQEEPVSLPTGSQRGGAKVDDYYFTFMVSLTFKINRVLPIFGGRKAGGSVECPKF